MPFLNIPLEGLSSEELNKFCAKSFVKEVKDKNYVTYEAYIASIFEKLARRYSGRSNETIQQRQKDVKTCNSSDQSLNHKTLYLKILALSSFFLEGERVH